MHSTFTAHLILLDLVTRIEYLRVYNINTLCAHSKNKFSGRNDVMSVIFVALYIAQVI